LKVDPIKYLITCSFKCQMNNFKEIMQEGKYWLWIMKTKISKMGQALKSINKDQIITSMKIMKKKVKNLYQQAKIEKKMDNL